MSFASGNAGMSRIAKIRRRRPIHSLLERDLIQQQSQFGYVGARLRSLSELHASCAQKEVTPERSTKKRDSANAPKRQKRRRNAPALAPGYVSLLSELRAQAHEKRVDNTLERLLQRQHRHLVRNARPLVPHDVRQCYVWKGAHERPGIAHHYRPRPPAPASSLWNTLERLQHTVGARASEDEARPARPPPPPPPPRSFPFSPEGGEMDVPAHLPATMTTAVPVATVDPDETATGPASEPTAFSAISTAVQRRWLQDTVRAIDLVPPDLHDQLPEDVRAFLASQPKEPLWPHQVDAAQRMLYCESHMRYGSRGGMICDEMGLGKTRLMFEIVYRTRQLQLLRDPHQRHHLPTLLVVPNSISYHPVRELKRAYPPNLLRVIRLCEGENPNARAGDITAHVDLIVTTYPTISRAYDAYFRGGRSTGYEVLFDLTYERVVVDEGHVFANPNTIMNHAAMQLSARAAHNWFFSGTPIQNRFSDIDAALQFIRVADRHIPQAPVVRVHTQNLLEIQRRLDSMKRDLRSEADRAEFRDLWDILTGKAAVHHHHLTHTEGEDGVGDQDEEAESDEEEEEEEEEAELLYALIPKKKKKQKKSHGRRSLIHITQPGVRHFLELYRCRSVMRVGQPVLHRAGGNGVDALVERTIAEVYRSLETTSGTELSEYTRKLEELLGTCMLRRTRANVASDFGRRIQPHARVTVALPGGKTKELEADGEGFLGPRYLRTHALFSRESDPFSEQLRFYDRDVPESLLYAFYDAYRINLMLHPRAPNIFEHDVTAQGPFAPAMYELAQAPRTRTEIVEAYLALRGDAATELDRQVCRIYERHVTVQKRARPRKRSNAETRTLVAQRSMMAICSQLGTCKRIFLPPFLDPPDASTSPAALFTQRTEYQRVTRLSPNTREYCQAAARELRLAGIDGPEDALWDAGRRLRMPAESTQFREVRRMLLQLRPGEKMIVPFNSVETLLQLYFYIREWFPLPTGDDDDSPHILPLALVGDMDSADRRVVMERFETNPDYNVLLASMQVTSLGHNLDMANLVLAPDANYNPFHLRQATFRAARPGQPRRILLRVLIPKGTMIEHALLINHEKMSKDEAAIGGERASSRSTAHSRRGASRISNFIDAWKTGDLDQMTRIHS